MKQRGHQTRELAPRGLRHHLRVGCAPDVLRPGGDRLRYRLWMAAPEACALLFDATGTLFELREAAGETYARVARAHGLDLPDWRLQDALRRVLASSDAMVFPGLPLASVPDAEKRWWRDVVRSSFLAADSDRHFADFEAFFDDLFRTFARAEAWRLRPGALAGLGALRQRGHRMGVASNFDHRLPYLLEQMELAPFFDSIMIPSNCGLAKPDAAFFRAAAAAVGTDTRGCVYLADDPAPSLEAARRAGLIALDVRSVGHLSGLPEAIDAAATLGRGQR